MTRRPHGRAFVNPTGPRAWASCDRCGFLYNHHKLRFQFDFAGPVLQNLRFLVCNTCYDKPQDQLKPVILPADPIPINNARPEPYAQDNTDWRVTQDGSFRVTQDDNLRVVQSGEWQSYPILTTSGTGTVATVTYSGITVPIGVTITITGVVPNLYNGSFVVTSSSSGSVSFSSVATGSQISAGTLIIPSLPGTR